MNRCLVRLRPSVDSGTGLATEPVSEREHVAWVRWICAGVLIVALAPRQAWGQSIPAGLAFLSQSQNSGGTWADPQDTAFRDTTVVLDTFAALGQKSAAGYLQGVASLENSIAPTNDYVSRQLVSLFGAEVDVSTQAGQLLDSQGTDIVNAVLPTFPGRGWGIGGGFATDTLDTALALRALETVGFTGGASVVNEQVATSATSVTHPFQFPAGASGLAILIRATTGSMRLLIDTPSSGTRFLDRDPSNVPVAVTGLPQQTGTYGLRVQNRDTVPIAYSLEARFTRADGFDVSRLTTPITYLGLAQNPDGGWGIARGEDSNLMITTEVLQTLLSFGTAFAPASALQRGVDWLEVNRHNPDGGFGSDGTSTTYETALAVLSIQGIDPTSSALGPARALLQSTQRANGSWNDDPYATALALRVIACRLDADFNEAIDVATDIVYVARHLLGLPPVPPSFRAQDPTIPSDAEIIAKIDALGASLDVDGNGTVDVATDVVYVARHLLNLTPVPPSFRVQDPSIKSDAEIAGAIDALCPLR